MKSVALQAQTDRGHLALYSGSNSNNRRCYAEGVHKPAT